MSFFSRRTIAAVAIATVASFPLIGSTAQAHETSATKSTHSHSKHVKKAKKFHAKFVLVGTVKAVDENSITVTVKGGNLKKGLRGKDVVVSVNETTKITVKDAPKTLADIVATDRVTVKGVRTLVEGTTTYTAKRVHVKHAVVKTESEPVETPTATITS